MLDLIAIPLGGNGALCAVKTPTGKFLRHWVVWTTLAALQVSSLQAAEYEITSFQDLGTIGNAIGGTYAEDINADGEIVGFAYNAAGEQSAFRWKNGTIQALPFFYAGGINDNGEIVGQLQLPSYDEFPDNPDNLTFRPTRPALYVGGVLSNLGTFDSDDPFSSGFCANINNFGVIVGQANEGRDANFVGTNFKAFRYAGSLAGISGFTLVTDGHSTANDINDEGVIVGDARTETGALRALMRFAGGPTIDITPTGMVSASAEAINANNDVLGNGTSPFVRKADGTFYIIPPISGATQTSASDINDERLVVGSMRINRINYAIFAEGNTLVDLNSLAESFLAQPGQPGIFRLENAMAINNSNQIACVGRYRDANGDEFWQRSCIITLKPKRNPVVFLHGIAGSELKVGSYKIWPSILALDVASLALLPDAAAVDVVREFAGTDFYGPFLSQMVSQRGYVEYDLEEDRSRLTSDHMLSVAGAKPTLFIFPYDWRADNATHTAILNQYIQTIRQLHNNSKVDLVAHSMGGLVVRRYLLDFGTGDIDKVITVGSPLLGAVKPIYLLHTGDFYDNALDTLNSSLMKASLATMPGLHQLLPAPPFLANSPPVFGESGVDLDRDGNSSGDYNLSQLTSTLKTLVAPTPSPMLTNQTFHNFNGGQQDDWSGDTPGAVKFLHFVGIQQLDNTIVKVEAKPYLTGLPFGNLLQRMKFVPVTGEGDGTVPILSSRRIPALLAPGSIIREIREPLAGVPSDKQPAGQAAEHTLLMSNLEVWAGIDEFLSTGELPAASPGPATLDEIPIAFAPDPEAPLARREISVIGAGYIKIRDFSGNTNAIVGDTAATRVPGVEARYGGSEPWVDLSFGADMHIILEGDPASEPVDILVTDFDGSGTVIGMRRHRFIPNGHAWQMVLPPDTVPDLRLDLNDNAEFDEGETVAATFSREGAAVDTKAPTVTLNITRSGENIVINLGGSDGPEPAPAVRYSVDGNAVQDYSSPLLFPRGEPHVLKAYAEDGVGNTSGLIETTLNPALSIGSAPEGIITLEWPVSDGYVLEEALSLEGPWPISMVTVAQSGLVNRAAIPIGEDPKKFFRLRAIPVAR